MIDDDDEDITQGLFTWHRQR